MKRFTMLLLVLCLFGCQKTPPVEEQTDPIEILPPVDIVLDIPAKEDPSSALMSASPIKPSNIDDYLYRDDCVYIDTRSAQQFHSEGSIGGFMNIPFYGYIADFKAGTGSLFQMTKVTDEDGTVYPLGEPGSFIPNYEESEQMIKALIPKNKTILVIATAGVESCYFINLLKQLGYDEAKLYNVGSFTTGMGNDQAYVGLEDVKHLVPPFELYDTVITYTWTGLTPIQK